MKTQNFIHTTDAETAEKLRKLGFQELECSEKNWTFLNKQSYQFTDIDAKKIKCDNKLTI